MNLLEAISHSEHPRQKYFKDKTGYKLSDAGYGKLDDLILNKKRDPKMNFHREVRNHFYLDDREAKHLIKHHINDPDGSITGTKQEDREMSNSRDIIDHLYSGDLNQMRDAFAENMLGHVAQVLETKRLEMASKIVSEENLQELGSKTLGRYIKKASNTHAQNAFDNGVASAKGGLSLSQSQIKKRSDGIGRATDKIVKRSVKEDEDLQELSARTLGRYIKGADRDKDKHTGNAHKALFPPMDRKRNWNEYDKHSGKSQRRGYGIAQATDKLVKKASVKEDEDIQELSTTKMNQYVAKAARDGKKDRSAGIDKVDKKVNKDFKD